MMMSIFWLICTFISSYMWYKVGFSAGELKEMRRIEENFRMIQQVERSINLHDRVPDSHK